MNLIKSASEIAIMKKGGDKLASILTALLEAAQPGVILKDIDDTAMKLISAAGGAPSFQTVSGYKWATCLCVNDVIVHGVPSRYALKAGDILTIDVGILYKGFHTDTAWTKVVGGKTNKFLEVGEKALWKAIAEARGGQRIGHVSQAIQETVEKAGFSVISALVGHGVGESLHEAPQIPGFLDRSIDKTPQLVPGMTIAIEVIYAMGKRAVVYDTGDGWSIATKDGSLSAVFEHTIAITHKSPVILTRE